MDQKTTATTEPQKTSFLVIDPAAPSISRLEFGSDAQVLPVMYSAIQCETVDCVCLGETLDGQALDMWIDDEGLEKPEQQTFAILDEAGGVLMVINGRAVIAASNSNGETVGLGDPVGEFERLKRRIGFAVAEQPGC